MEKKYFKAVELNHLDDSVIDQIRIWRNADFVRKQSFSKDEITQEQHRKYIEKLKNDPDKGIFVFYLDDEPFAVYNYNINRLNNSVLISFYLTNEDYQYLGYGTIMSYYTLQINFNIFNVNKQCGEIIDTNRKLIASLKKEDITVIEGILRDHIIIDGKYHDVYLTGLLKKDYKTQAESFFPLIDKIVHIQPLDECVII